MSDRRRLPVIFRRCGVAALALVAALAGSVSAAAAELVRRGIYYWSEEREDFGGFSGLAVAADGASLMAVSDAGWLFHAAIRRDSAGRITGIETDWQARFLDNFGRPVEGFTADAEALAVAEDGTAYVGFESYARIAALKPPDMMPEPQHRWDRFRAFWGNESFEALALRPEGGLIAILEEPVAPGEGFTTLLGDDGDWREGPRLPDGDGFAASDAAFGPDGRLYLLERRFALTAGYATRIRRFDYAGGRFGPGETLLETAPGALDNMEGISLWRDAAGRTVVSLISDDNFLPIQNTLVVEYDLTE